MDFIGFVYDLSLSSKGSDTTGSYSDRRRAVISELINGSVTASCSRGAPIASRRRYWPKPRQPASCLQPVCCCALTEPLNEGRTRQRATRVSPQTAPGLEVELSHCWKRREETHTHTQSCTIIHHTSPTATILTSVSPAPP